MKPKPIGIHLGDFYSSVGTFEYTGVPEVIANDHGNLSTPSYVAFVGDQQVLIGEAAYDQANTNTMNTVFAVNRFIGRMFEDELVQKQIANVPFSIVNVGGWPMIEVEYRKYSPIWPMIKTESRKYSPKDICSMVLGKLKQTAESYLTTKVTEAVITVPDYFNESQHEAMKDAASKVGLTVLRFVSESATVTIAYGLDQLEKCERKNVLILELSHEKTLNASIVNCAKSHELLALKSDNIVKGEDKLTDIMVNWLLSKITNKRMMETDETRLKEEFYNTGFNTENLRCICKIAKKEFLRNSSINFKFSDLIPYSYCSYFHFTSENFKFSNIVRKTFKSTEKLINDLLEDAKLDIKDIDAVILVGPTTRVIKLDLFFKTNFIDRNVKIYESIPHDKVFAYGTTVQAAHLQDEYSSVDRLFRFDCTPLNIGILVDGGIVCPVIERGTKIPTEKLKIFKFPTFSSSWIRIYEGQCLFAQDNNYLEGIFISLLQNERVGITFEIDVKGTLIVSTNIYGFHEPIEIKNVKQRRTRAEIELMWEYAELHRVRDDYVRKEMYCSLTKLENAKNASPYFICPEFKSNFNGEYFDCANTEIELPLLESLIPQTLDTMIQEINLEIASLKRRNLPFKKVIYSLNIVRDILNRYRLIKNEFDSVFINEEKVILKIFKQTICLIRELMLHDFLLKFYQSKIHRFNIQNIAGLLDITYFCPETIPNNILKQIRSIQNLLILLINVLDDNQTLLFGCSYFGVTYNNTEEIQCEVPRCEIIDSSVISILKTIEIKIEQLLQSFNALSANNNNNSITNSPQITNVIYNLKNLKNVLLNINSDSQFGDITFTNDESVVTKNEHVDLNNLEHTISEMQKSMLKYFELREITVPETELQSSTGITDSSIIDNVLQQMSEIEQLVNALVSANRKIKSKRITQNKCSKIKRLQRKRNVENEQSDPFFELSNQNELETNTTFKIVFNGALLAFVGYCLMKRVSQ